MVHTGDLDLLKTSVSTIQEDVSTIETSISTIEGDITTLQSSVENLSVGGVDIAGQTYVDVASGDQFLIADVSNSNNLKKTTTQSIANLTKTLSVATYTSSNTITSEDVVLVDASSAAVTVTLPNISGTSGKVLHIKKNRFFK